MSMRFQIQCGQISEFIEAKNHETAFRKIVRKLKPETLGMLMRFRMVGYNNKPLKFHRAKGEQRGLWKYQDPLVILNNPKKKRLTNTHLEKIRKFLII